jgi:protein-L-isoaspartate(D-aspartate) O-methyltransferase
MDSIQGLIDDIEAQVHYTRHYIGRDRLSPRVLRAMRSVPREEFVPTAKQSMAYCDGPLPIGHGQTISQPYIVALMTDLLAPEPGHVVLELGTGSGYQAAVLAQLVARVYTIEIIPALATEAHTRLSRLGYGNVEVRVGDGYGGWPEHAPFDSIIVTAGAAAVPPPLLTQLRPGGRLVMPVGGYFSHQELTIIDKDLAGDTRARRILPVAFVPLTGVGGQGAQEE